MRRSGADNQADQRDGLVQWSLATGHRDEAFSVAVAAPSVDHALVRASFASAVRIGHHDEAFAVTAPPENPHPMLPQTQCCLMFTLDLLGQLPAIANEIQAAWPHLG